MNQTFDTQLQVVLRALNDVIAPALAGADKHVVEQLHLSVATLSFLKQRLPSSRRYYRMELDFYISLGAEAAAIAKPDLAERAAAINDMVITGRSLLDRADAENEDYQEMTRHLREKLAELCNLTEGLPCKSALDSHILSRSDQIIVQSRLWCAPFGFETNIETLGKASW